jgi:hypothetical protein
VTPTSAAVFTTAVEATTGTWGAPLGDVVNNTWPSDHAAVVVDFDLAEIDADGNGLSDVWEMKWFGETGNNPQLDMNGDGLRLIDAFRFGLAPVGAPQRPLEAEVREGNIRLLARLSNRALGAGVTLQASSELLEESWQSLWSYDNDPGMEAEIIMNIDPQGDGAWSLEIADPLALNHARRFYRFHTGSPPG